MHHANRVGIRRKKELRLESLETRKLLSADGILVSLPPTSVDTNFAPPEVAPPEVIAPKPTGPEIVVEEQPETVVTVATDAQGRKVAVVQLTANVVRIVDHYQYDGDTSNVAQHVQEQDQGADGTVEYRSVTNYQYENGTLVSESTQADTNGDGSDDQWSSTNYDGLGRVVSASSSSDSNGDGVADSSFRSTTEYRADGTHSEYRSDFDGDGVDDAVGGQDITNDAQGRPLHVVFSNRGGGKDYTSVTDYTYDGEQLVTVTQSDDDNGDGTVDRISVTTYHKGTDLFVSSTTTIDDNADGIIDQTIDNLIAYATGGGVKDPSVKDTTGDPVVKDAGGEVIVDDVKRTDDEVPGDDNSGPVVSDPTDGGEVIYYMTGGGLQVDLNHDGMVNADDAELLFANWGQAGTGDLNGDGIVDAADADALFSGWSA